MAPEEEEIDEPLLSRINRGYPRDLLRRFADNSAAGNAAAAAADGGDVGEIELGLSLGGCYAAEPKGMRLARASSMTLSVFPGERIDFPVVTTPLTRTYSLPTETEEERRKRKEMECLKRMEAKRKRLEKRAAATINNNWKEENLLGEDLVNKGANGVVFPAEMAKLAAGTGGQGGARPASQGSIGSQGSSLSGVSDFESRPVQGGEAWTLWIKRIHDAKCGLNNQSIMLAIKRFETTDLSLMFRTVLSRQKKDKGMLMMETKMKAGHSHSDVVSQSGPWSLEESKYHFPSARVELAEYVYPAAL